MKFRLLFFLTVLFLVSCDPTKRAAKSADSKTLDHKHPSHHYTFPYDLSQPDALFEMPKKLDEISGIAFTTNHQTIYAIQDENGILFQLDKHTGKVIDKVKFNKDGDYEDIACVGNKTYIVKSTGTLYELEMTPADTFKVSKHKFGLKKENDVEGLCFDKKNNRLLLACKGEMTQKELAQKDNLLAKGVYAYNLVTKKLEANPAFKLTLEEVQHYVNEHHNVLTDPLFEKFMAGEQKSFTFFPSAIAIHPKTGNIYLASSKGKILSVINTEGEILFIQKLSKKVHKQPEGLAFDQDGTLYISNESKDKIPANIQRFKYSPK